MGVKDRALALKSLDILPATFIEVLTKIVKQTASITESTLSRRKLGVEGSAVAKTKCILKLAKITIGILATLALLLVLLSFLAGIPVVFTRIAFLGCISTFGCVVVILSSSRCSLQRCDINEIP